jgi:ABC-2 type transport system permease protein
MSGDIPRELWLAVRLRLRPLPFFLAGIASTAMWLVVVLLAVAWYGGNVAYTVRFLFWGAVVFLVFSEQTWGAAAFGDLARNGVMDYVAASPTRLHSYLLAASLASSLAATPGVFILLGIYYLIQGELPPLAQPAYFVAGLAIFLTAAALITSLFTLVFIRLRNPSLAANAVQWAIPLSGGMIPPTAMPPEAAKAFLLSPFQYVIAPVVYSATGSWLVDPPLALAAGTAVVAVLYVLSVRVAESAVEGYKTAGRWGVE